MSQHIFDYAIIGSGIAGLTTAVRLSRETSNLILLDGADHPGGVNRPITVPTGVINNGLRHMADTPTNRAGLNFLESLLGLKVLRGSLEIPPVTFEQGQLREFLGFGDRSPDFYEQMVPYANAQRLELHLEPHAWPALLMEKFTGTFSPRSYVTKIAFAEEGASLTINGSKVIKATNVIYTGPVKSLGILLGDAMGARAKQKLSKNSYWTGLCLDLCHAQVQTESMAMHILDGTTQDEMGPCAGRFLPAMSTPQGMQQTSQWMTFLQEEVTEDSEIVGQSLKKIKRQIKRAHPTAFDGLIRERIMIAPMMAGTGDLKLNGDQTLPDLPNLWIASPSLSMEAGIGGALAQAQMVLAALQFGPLDGVPAAAWVEAKAGV